MDKIYIVRSDSGYIFRAYSSVKEAETYKRHIENTVKKGNKFLPKSLQSRPLDLQLIAIPVSNEGDPLDMRLTNIHASGGDPAMHYELGEVM